MRSSTPSSLRTLSPPPPDRTDEEEERELLGFAQRIYQKMMARDGRPTRPVELNPTAPYLTRDFAYLFGAHEMELEEHNLRKMGLEESSLHEITMKESSPRINHFHAELNRLHWEAAIWELFRQHQRRERETVHSFTKYQNTVRQDSWTRGLIDLLELQEDSSLQSKIVEWNEFRFFLHKYFQDWVRRLQSRRRDQQRNGGADPRESDTYLSVRYSELTVDALRAMEDWSAEQLVEIEQEATGKLEQQQKLNQLGQVMTTESWPKTLCPSGQKSTGEKSTGQQPTASLKGKLKRKHVHVDGETEQDYAGIMEPSHRPPLRRSAKIAETRKRKVREDEIGNDAYSVPFGLPTPASKPKTGQGRPRKRARNSGVIVEKAVVPDGAVSTISRPDTGSEAIKTTRALRSTTEVIDQAATCRLPAATKSRPVKKPKRKRVAVAVDT